MEIKDNDLITGDILKQLGFAEVIINKPEDAYRHGNVVYRITPPRHEAYGFYAYELQMELRKDLPGTNPNSGIFSIYSPKAFAHAVPDDLLEKEKWSDDDRKRAHGYKIELEEFTTPIVWYITKVGRLKDLYWALTQMELEEVKL